MPNAYDVRNTDMEDLEIIFSFFDHSVDYQEKHGVPVWKNYDRNAIINDIKNKNQYKIVIDSQIALVFSVAYSDKLIWRDLEQGDAVYLHRIVVNPDFKGNRLFGNVATWTIKHCMEKGLKKIRMDTWASNFRIVEYYKTFGFRPVENYTTPDSAGLPVHNRNLALTLLEYATA